MLCRSAIFVVTEELLSDQDLRSRTRLAPYSRRKIAKENIARVIIPVVVCLSHTVFAVRRLSRQQVRFANLIRLIDLYYRESLSLSLFHSALASCTRIRAAIFAFPRHLSYECGKDIRRLSWDILIARAFAYFNILASWIPRISKRRMSVPSHVMFIV
jgi:hypothetical protein